MTVNVMAIAGKSGSGKTTLAQKLQRALKNSEIVSLDSYYHDLSHLSYNDRGKMNFDVPTSLDAKLFEADLAKIKNNESIEVPSYDFTKHCRAGLSKTINNKKNIIVEGIFSLYFEPILQFYNLSIYLDIPNQVARNRRINRDINERERGLDSIIEQYDRQVTPMSKRYIIPTRSRADLILNSLLPIDVQIEKILSRLPTQFVN